MAAFEPKRCLECNTVKAPSDFYIIDHGTRLQGRCKKCHNAGTVARKKAKAATKRAIRQALQPPNPRGNPDIGTKYKGREHWKPAPALHTLPAPDIRTIFEHEVAPTVPALIKMGLDVALGRHKKPKAGEDDYQKPDKALLMFFLEHMVGKPPDRTPTQTERLIGVLRELDALGGDGTPQGADAPGAEADVGAAPGDLAADPVQPVAGDAALSPGDQLAGGAGHGETGDGLPTSWEESVGSGGTGLVDLLDQLRLDR